MVTVAPGTVTVGKGAVSVGGTMVTIGVPVGETHWRVVRSKMNVAPGVNDIGGVRIAPEVSTAPGVLRSS